jgi:hypothetical protein
LKGNNFYSVIVDGDDSKNGKDKWCERIKSKCESDGADFKKLTKREIENYCHHERIKKCIVAKIKEKEGENTKNPRIEVIKSSTIEISDTTDVEKYLKEMGLFNNFKNGLNIEVFNCMTKDEWKKTDNEEEIKTFIEEIYKKIE